MPCTAPSMSAHISDSCGHFMLVHDIYSIVNEGQWNSGAVLVRVTVHLVGGTAPDGKLSAVGYIKS